MQWLRTLSRQHWLRGLVGGCTLFLGACSANSSDPRPSGRTSPAPTVPDTNGAPDGVPSTSRSSPLLAPPSPLRRLTREEYNNTVRDLLNDSSAPAGGFAGESIGGSGFATPGIVSAQDVSGYMDAAEALSSASMSKLISGLNCDPALQGDAICAKRFVESFGGRAYRRTLTAAEEADLLQVFTEAGALPGNVTFTDKLQLLVRAILQSPQFLYHWELGLSAPKVANGVVRLTPYEVASRLSYFLWSTMPDDALLGAAEANRLGTPNDLAAEVTRMLQDPKARDTVTSFHSQWLKLDNLLRIVKDPTTYPLFNDALRRDMKAENAAFVNHVLLDSDAKLTTLLSATFSFVNEPLAKLYGVTGVTGTGLRKVALNASERAGILTQTALLSTTANAYEGSLILRGKLLREQFLCQRLAPPPAVVPPIPALAPGQSLRERSVIHMSNASCKVCHELMDPIGYGFGNYDAIGAYRTTEAGKTIDASGSISGLDGSDQSFNGPAELAALLSTSSQVRNCVAKQWFRFAFRRAELPEDAPSLSSAFDAFEKADYDIRTLLSALAQSPSFSYRSLAPGELSQ